MVCCWSRDKFRAHLSSSQQPDFPPPHESLSSSERLERREEGVGECRGRWLTKLLPWLMAGAWGEVQGVMWGV